MVDSKLCVERNAIIEIFTKKIALIKSKNCIKGDLENKANTSTFQTEEERKNKKKMWVGEKVGGVRSEGYRKRISV